MDGEDYSLKRYGSRTLLTSHWGWKVVFGRSRVEITVPDMYEKQVSLLQNHTKYNTVLVIIYYFIGTCSLWEF